jgi:hypothetical protein
MVFTDKGGRRREAPLPPLSVNTTYSQFLRLKVM